MAITIDTHALIWYLDNDLNGKLSPIALNAIEEAVNSSVVYVSAIVIMEIMHISERSRINLNFTEMLDKIIDSPCYRIVPLDINIIRAAVEFPAIEMHDRLICATALSTGSSLVSKDAEIKKNISVIW
jgi:PIN domain nuclease of toxin-antitoxin system